MASEDLCPEVLSLYLFNTSYYKAKILLSFMRAQRDDFFKCISECLSCEIPIHKDCDNTSLKLHTTGHPMDTQEIIRCCCNYPALFFPRNLLPYNILFSISFPLHSNLVCKLHELEMFAYFIHYCIPST